MEVELGERGTNLFITMDILLRELSLNSIIMISYFLQLAGITLTSLKYAFNFRTMFFLAMGPSGMEK